MSMKMDGHRISSEQLEHAKQFFQDSSVDVLTNVAIKINTEQPEFTGVILALEMHGLDRTIIEDLLESIFVVYYIHTKFNKKIIPLISPEQVINNINQFGQFINYYNQEKRDSPVDLSKIQFLRDEVVLNFAVVTLHHLFGGIKNIPREVMFGYFGLLKGIELGAERSA